MSTTKPKDVVASVRQRLLNYSRQHGEEYQATITRYATERFLYRLSKSPHVSRFILKGAALFYAWTNVKHRPTRDIDFLGQQGDRSPETLTAIIRDVCNTEAPDDGLKFDAESINIAEIQEGRDYNGQRIRLVAFLGNARTTIQIDVGFGDVVTPGAKEITFPTILDSPAPRLLGYTIESVIAEKLHAIVALGIANSRMKDFFDIWSMSEQFDLDGKSVSRAIRETFERRKTTIPSECPIALTSEFSQSREKDAAWRAFLRRIGLAPDSSTLVNVTETLQAFVMPLLTATSRDQDLEALWPKRGPWSTTFLT